MTAAPVPIKFIQTRARVVTSNVGLLGQVAKVECSFLPPQDGVFVHLQSLFQLAQAGAANEDIARATLEVESSLGPLLQGFPRDFFSSLASIEDFQPMKDPADPTRDLTFKPISYPYVESFVEHLETWLRAIGCTNVDVALTPLFSKSSETNILHLTGAYKSGKLALFLGAGISKQLELPIWDQLLERMVETWMAHNGANPVIASKLRGLNLTQQARWLKVHLGSEYLQALKEALYRDAYRHGTVVPIALDTISRMTRLRAICTYNYDDLLERHSGNTLQSVASAADYYSGEQIPVYHVHGLLPYAESPRGDLILSEADYHDLANEPLRWSNVVQIHLLRECTCVLIGLSGADPNLRRLLDLVGREKSGDTYIIQKTDKLPSSSGVAINDWSTSKEIDFDRELFADIHLKCISIPSYDLISHILETCLEE